MGVCTTDLQKKVGGYSVLSFVLFLSWEFCIVLERAFFSVPSCVVFFGGGGIGFGDSVGLFCLVGVFFFGLLLLWGFV